MSVFAEPLAQARAALHVNLGVWEKADVLAALDLIEQRATDMEKALRCEWWLNHGHPYESLYGDDGEMQCGQCPADFKREPLDELQGRVFGARAAALSAREEAR